MQAKEDFLLKAYQLGIIKFGTFILKSGIESPFYVDLRPLASSPQLLKTLSNNLLKLVDNSPYELICGVPYAALPMATTMSLESGIPLIIKRKENKGYGTKRMVEGVFHDGQNCMLVEDVITSGKSLLETIEEVEREGLKVTDICVVLDREQGGISRLQKQGYKVHTLFTINEVIEILFKNKKLEADQVNKIQNFLNSDMAEPKIKRISYEEKLNYLPHSIAKRILKLAIEKQSNLIVSADVTTTKELLDLAKNIGNEIVALKTHIDIIEDFTPNTILELQKIANEKNFLLFEDRKFADIGNTQELQFNKGIYKISTWADMITSHVIAGENSLRVFGNIGVVGIVEMSSKGTLTDSYYVGKALEEAEKAENVFAVVAQSKVPKSLLLFTPGVNIENEGDEKGQQYNTPEKVFTEYHTDFMIVGRGIYKSSDPKTSAENYKKRGWKAYEESLK